MASRVSDGELQGRVAQGHLVLQPPQIHPKLAEVRDMQIRQQGQGPRLGNLGHFSQRRWLKRVGVLNLIVDYI